MRKKVLVTGGSGLVGSSIKRLSRSYDYDFSFLNGRRDGFDLTKEGDVQKIFALYRPSYVIHCAAKVGGVKDNLEFQADFYYENLLINIHMIHYAVIHKVEKFFAFCSNCIFADGEILRESNIHKGEPFRGTRGYAYAKRMVDVQIDTCKDQHMVQNYCSLIPGNIFGENDFFNLESGHAIPSLIHKLYRAKKNREALTVWGDGSSVTYNWPYDFCSLVELAKIETEIKFDRNKDVEIETDSEKEIKQTSKIGLDESEKGM